MNMQFREDAPVLLTPSRISPGKRTGSIVESAPRMGAPRRTPEETAVGLSSAGTPPTCKAADGSGTSETARLAGCGESAVIFPGHVTGLRKRAFFALADLYVFPSKHESYGLTLLKALAAGLPAVCLDHEGARSVMGEDFGRIVHPRRGLRSAIVELLARRKFTPTDAGAAARKPTRAPSDSDAAAQLATVTFTRKRASF